MTAYDRCYRAAYDAARGYESSSRAILRNMRETIRAELLDQFPEMDGPDIAYAMDDALSVVWGPVDNYS